MDTCQFYVVRSFLPLRDFPAVLSNLTAGYSVSLASHGGLLDAEHQGQATSVSSRGPATPIINFHAKAWTAEALF